MAKLGECPLCPPGSSRAMQEAAWSAWIDGGAAAVRALYRARLIEVEEEVVKSHFNRHRPLQGPAERLSAREALQAWAKLPARRQAILSLLFRSPGMSARQIADLLFLGENPRSALPGAERDLRWLQRRGFLFQAFVEQLPGGGPRPTGGHPGLYFPGVNSRAVFRRETGRAPALGSEWWSSVDDWSSWQEAYESWQRAELRNETFRMFPLVGPGYRGAPGMRLDWAGIHDRDHASFLFEDPLLGRTRLRAEGLIGISIAEGTVPVLLQHDRGSLDVSAVTQRAAELSALHRSGELERRFALPSGARALLLLLSDSPERVESIRRESLRRTVAGDSPALICDRQTAQLGLQRAVWQPLFREAERIDLLQALRGMAHWPLLEPGRSLCLRRSRNPQPGETPAISSNG